MSWLNIDDGMGEHPKVVAAGHAAMGLWLELACWSARNHLAEGLVPKAQVEKLGTAAEIRALLKSGLLVRAKSGYQLHDWLQWNESAAVVEAKKEAARKRMKGIRDRRKRSPEQSENSSLELPGNFDGISRSHSTPPLKGERSARQKGGVRSSNDNPADIPVCPIHQQQGVVCISCAADRKAGGAA